jgi:hypothetical protein
MQLLHCIFTKKTLGLRTFLGKIIKYEESNIICTFNNYHLRMWIQ